VEIPIVKDWWWYVQWRVISNITKYNITHKKIQLLDTTSAVVGVELTHTRNKIFVSVSLLN
jgi:hypothetical protein